VRLNLSKSGLSASFGVPGATLNIGPRGAMSTLGVPGTGLSYRQHHSFTHPHEGGGGGPAFEPGPGPQPSPQPVYYQPLPQMREINSASVEQLTSASLVELRNMISEARSQRSEIEADLAEARTLQTNEEYELERKQGSIFRWFYKRRIAALEESAPQVAAEVERLEGWLASTHIPMQFETSPDARQTYGALTRAFDALRASTVIWDITSDRATNRVMERTSAHRTLLRTPIALDYATSDLIQFEGRAMRFGNANGEDILIYPGMMMMPRGDGAFALIDLREVRLESSVLQFVEAENVPADSEVVGYTWAKVNKDGSPDRRFRDNYQIPVCAYGCLNFTSEGGVMEEYQFSKADAALAFARAFQAYQAALSN
jgi:hypothetical protein